MGTKVVRAKETIGKPKMNTINPKYNPNGKFKISQTEGLRSQNRRFCISVGITVKNDNWVVETLDSIMHQSRMPDEIILVDAFSTDGTKELLDERVDLYRSSGLPIMITQKEGNIATGRNMIMNLANGEYVAMTDSDCIADVNWLKELENSVLSNSAEIEDNVDVVGGLTGVFGEGVQADVKEHNPAFVKVDGVEVDFAYQTRNVLLNKETVDRIGGFNTDYILYEDMDLMCRIAKKGGKIVYNSNARVYHKNSPNTKRYIMKMYNDALWSAIFYDDHTDAYGGGRSVGQMAGRAMIDELIAVLVIAAGTTSKSNSTNVGIERVGGGMMGLLEGILEELGSII